LRLPDDVNKYSHRWKWLELGRYSKDLDRVFRVTNKKTKVPITVEYKDVEKFANDNNRLGIYTSVFHYDDKAYDKATRLGSIYFDLDSTDIELAQRDAIKIVDSISCMLSENQLRIYFTGKKGFHIEMEALAVGVTPSNDLPSIYRLIANDMKDSLNLETIDFAVYDLRRMWRLPNTIHQGTGLYKIPLTYKELTSNIDTIKDLAASPKTEYVEEQQFSYEANRWYKEYVYRYEESLVKKTSIGDVIDLFNKNGSSGVRKGSKERQFNPIALFDNCPSILRMWEKAERVHHLDHEERLFLCSVLSYTDEAIQYLHQILSLCSDYDYDRTASHIDDWLARRDRDIGGRPYSCKTANEKGIGCGDCDTKMDRRKKWIRVGNGYVESEEYAEPSPVRYAYSNVTKDIK